MGRLKKPFRVYLFTRPPKPKADKQEDGAAITLLRVKLRVQVIANGKSHFAVFPLLVRADFPKYFNSNGTLKEGYTAVSPSEIYESSCVAIAYQAACNVAEFMLSHGDDYWKLSPNAYFSDVVNSEYYNLSEGLTSWVKQREENDARRRADGLVTFVEENLADWRFAAGMAPEPPNTTYAEDWKDYFKRAEEEQKG